MKKHILSVLFLIFAGSAALEAMSIQQKCIPNQKAVRKSLSILIKKGSWHDLNDAANFMLVSARLYDAFKEIYPVIPKLKKYQDIRIVDDGKSFIRCYGSHPTENCFVQLSRKTKCGNEYGFYTSNPEAKAFMLQIASILKLPGNAFNIEKISFLENILKSNRYNTEIQILSEIALHAIYAHKFYKIYNNAPAVIKQLSLTPVFYENVLPVIINELNCNNHVREFIDILMFPKQIFALAAELDNYYRKKGDDYPDSIIITKQFNALAQKIASLSKQFEHYKNEYNNLYKILIRMLVFQGRKNKISVFNYKARNSLLFDAYSFKKKGKYICNDNILPAELWKIKKNNKNFYDKDNHIVDKEIQKKQTQKEAVVEKNDKASKDIQKIDHKNSTKQKSWAQIAVVKPPIQLNNNVVSTHLQLNSTKYDSRVLRWFDKENTGQEIINAHYISKLYHSFPLCIDKYIFSLGIKTDWKNQTNPSQTDINYSLGGEIIYPNGKQEQVVFTCCKDPQDVCYHRGFTVKEKNSLFEEYFAQSHWEVNFPPLELTNSINNAPAAYTYQDKDNFGSYVISENDFCIRIYDNKNKVTIILYKPYK